MSYKLKFANNSKELNFLFLEQIKHFIEKQKINESIYITEVEEEIKYTGNSQDFIKKLK